MPYSFVGIQNIVLATSFPDIYWNCACLIVNSGGVEDAIDVEEGNYKDGTVSLSKSLPLSNKYDMDNDEDEEGIKKTIETPKKRTRATNYGKIATAIGKMASEGVLVESPNINQSRWTFSPVRESNTIRYGLVGINKIGNELVHTIIDNRPYSSIQDFLDKVKVNKPQMVNLIKAGAFDTFGIDRVDIMKKYIQSISDQKKQLNLRNMQMLLNFNLIPDKLSFEVKVWNFTKYIRKFKDGNYYLLSNTAMKFYESNFDIDLLSFQTVSGDIEAKILKKDWDKIYNGYMDKVRIFIKENHDELLEKVNEILIYEMKDKYATGSISKWEMDSLSYYSHEHELSIVNDSYYEFVDYFDLPEEPEVDKIIYIKGKKVPLLKLSRIAGTVLDKDKNRGNVTVLTESGVVNVKIWRNQFAEYDRQISIPLPNGKKKIVEKSWFTRGNKLAIVGVRQGDNFIPKKYRNSKWQEVISLITNISETGKLTFKTEREAGVNN